MSLRAVPLIAFVLVLYNIVVFVMGTQGVAPDATGADGAVGILRETMFVIPMFANEAGWTFTWGDFIIAVLLITLFVEILKATYTATAALVDHGLSMLVFVVCLVEFLMVPAAQTSVFFFITLATAIDVIAGYTIGIRVARRDIGFGGIGAG